MRAIRQCVPLRPSTTWTSAALPAPNAATVMEAVKIIENEPERVQKLWNNAEYMRAGLKKLGFRPNVSALKDWVDRLKGGFAIPAE